MSAYLQPSFEGWGHGVAGYIDADGNFSATINKKGVIKCCFQIEARDDEAETFDEIQARLGGIGGIYRYHYPGNTSRRPRNPTIKLVVQKRKDLIETLIPFFEKYPLRAKKQKGYEVWAKLVRLMDTGKHLVEPGRKEAVALIDKLRQSRQYAPALDGMSKKAGFDNAFRNWLVGFVWGDGTFAIQYDKDSCFNCNLHIRVRDDDRPVLEMIRLTLGAGSIYAVKGCGRDKPQVGWCVSKTSDLYNLIIPLFDSCSFKARKWHDYEIWKQAVVILYSKGPRRYTKEQREKLTRLKQELQEGRKYKAKGI